MTREQAVEAFKKQLTQIAPMTIDAVEDMLLIWDFSLLVDIFTDDLMDQNPHLNRKDVEREVRRRMGI